VSRAGFENTRPELHADEARTLPARHYTDASLFARELEAIHQRMWLHAGRTESLDAPGRYFLVRFAGVDVIVLRDDAGQVRAFHNTCRHRGTLLCREPEGRLAGSIQCPYHAWTYGLDGRLKSAPMMEKVVGFDSRDHALGAVATAVWDGHVFVNLSDRPEPFADHLAGLDRRFAPWAMGELRRAERRAYPLKTNWKLVIQNYSECLHCPIVHPLLNQQSHYMSGDNEPPQPTWLGGSMELREGVKTLSVDGQTRREPLPGLSRTEQRCVYYYALLPNLLLNLHPDYMLTFQIWPLAVDRTDVVCEWHFHPAAMAAPGFDPSDAVLFWDLTNRQDWELTERALEGISTIGYRPGPYSNREDLLVGFDRFVLGRLAPTEEDP
jgi:phenylpropionate dioxygenase-like ring-hydroxylating dioxygenase large terminal subunit